MLHRWIRIYAVEGEFKGMSADEFRALRRRYAKLTPKQNSSGGRTSLGGITQRDDMYLRMLLIQAARSAVLSADKRSDPISHWVQRLRE